ncbi:neutral zinc metallopeptidase [Tessaracoccus sp. MC1756]|uniref:neutral zinc metallopeptidase n=1 Tax=Tessaracoccus sp. MC1756 TaxID=2760311 RepID=UPI0016040865|nr:neutral zinc metallopeptidase [Tessaracoccus sp. MC1756]
MRTSSHTVRPRRARPRFRLGPTTLIAVVTTLVLSLALVIFGMNLKRAPDTGPAPAEGEPVPAPGAGPGEWDLPEQTWEPLPGPDPLSPLYDAQVTTLNALAPATLEHCATPKTVRDEAEWEAAVRDQWFCVHRSWVPTFQQLGWLTTAPGVQFFAGEGDDSACGYLEAPAFYCSAGGGSVHFGARHFDMARTWDLSVNEMVNHEYGHHLQSLAGITRAKTALANTPVLERRAELQATCWSAAMTRHNSAFSFGQEQYESWMERLETMRADGVHGSRESLLYWGTRGLYAATMNDCNTWAVPDDQVA